MIATVVRYIHVKAAVATSIVKDNKIMHKKTISILMGLLLGASLAFGQSGENLLAFRNLYASATAPVVGTNAIQTLTVGNVSAGTFTLSFEGRQTASITWVGVNATLVTNINNALVALPNIGASGVVTAAGTITAGANGTITVTFQGNRAKQAVPVMTSVSTGLTGGTIVPTLTTPGVTADGRILAKGSLVVALDTGKWYTQTGTPPNPVWSIITSTP